MFRKNVASQFIHFQGVDSSTGGIKSGVTWTVRRCIDGTFAAATGTVTEDGTTGWYKFAMSQADTNGNNIAFNFTGTGAVPQTVNIVTTACDPTSATFGLTLAKTTNITGFNDIAATDIVSAGAITTNGGAVSNVTTTGTATNVTTVNGLAAGVITAASIAADAITDAKVAADVTIASVTGSVGSVTGAVGSVTGNVGGNVVGSVASVTGAVGSVTGNVGGNVVGSVASVTAAVTVGAMNAAALADLFDTDSGTTYASAVAGSVVKEIADNAGGSSLTAAEIADAVWDEDATGHQTQGTFGQAIGDPGADTDTIFGLLNTNLDATVSSRLASASYTAPDNTSITAILADTNELQTDWADGGRLDLILDARASQASVDTIDTNVDAILVDTAEIGAAGAGLTAIPWNAAWDAEVQSEVDDALVVHRLDELLNADSDIDGLAPPTVGSVFHELMTKTAGSFTYDQTTDSLEAVRDRGDAAWITATGFSTHTAANVADAVWEELIADHSGTTGSTAEALNAAGAAGDPWTTALPGAYGAGSAGYIIGNNIDAAISSRLATAGYTAPDNASITAILADTNELQTDWANGGRLDLILDATATQASVDVVDANVDAILVDTGTTLDAALAVVDANVDAIKAKTDSLAFTVAGQVDANTKYVAGTAVGGAGTEADPWGPA